MKPDDLLRRLLLDADGGLDADSKARLEQDLARDPNGARLRTEVRETWSRLQSEARVFRLADDFGTREVRSWCRGLNDGWFVGAPVLVAASLLCLLTLRGGLVGPMPAGSRQDHDSLSQTVALAFGDTVRAAEGGSIVRLSGGMFIDLTEGSIEVAGLEDVRLLAEPSTASVHFGASDREIEIPGGRLVGRDADLQWRVRPMGGGLEVRLEIGSGRVLLERDGLHQLDASTPVMTYYVPRDGTGRDVRGGGPGEMPAAPTGPGEPTVTPPAEPVERSPIVPMHDSEPKRDDVPATEDADEVTGPVLTGLFHPPAGELFVRGGVRIQVQQLSAPSDDVWADAGLHLPSDARVWARSVDAVDVDMVSCDHEGRFAFHLLPPGLYRLSVRIDERRHAYADPETRLVRLGHDDRALEWSLRPGVVLTGRVIDELGRPVLGAVVRTDTREVVTDLQGRYALPASAEEGEPWVIEAKGYAPRRIDPASETVRGVVQLERPRRLRLDVRSFFGGGVDDAEAVVSWMEAGELYERSLRTGPGDSRVLRGLPHRPSKLVVRADGFMPASICLPGGTNHLERVVDLRPADEAELILRGVDVDVGLSVPCAWLGNGVIGRARSDDGGLVQLRGLDPAADSVRVLVFADAAAVRTARVTPGWTRTVDLTEARPRSADVRDWRGEPVSDLWALWTVRDTETGVWLAARGLDVDEWTGRVALPDLDLGSSNAPNAEVVVLFGAGDRIDAWRDDGEGSRLDVLFGGPSRPR